MSEVEKLYENAGLKNLWVERYSVDSNIEIEHWHKSYNDMLKSMMKNNDWDRKTAIEIAKKECKNELPPFTAEKQLNILKTLSFRQGILLKQHRFFIGWEHQDPNKLICSENSDLIFEEALAGLINTLWQSLTEEERNSIKDILNGKIKR